MDVSFTIPEWVLWLLGVPVVLAIIAFAVFGYVIAKALSKGGGFWR